MAAGRGPRALLLDGKRGVVALHMPWGQISGPVALAVAGLVLALFVDAKTLQSLGVVVGVVWIGWFGLLLTTLHPIPLYPPEADD